MTAERKRELNTPRLRVHTYGGDTSEWHYLVSEHIRHGQRIEHVPLAWGEATHPQDAMVAGQNALKRVWATRATPTPPQKEPEKTTERPFLTAASSLASSERRWSFGFSTGYEATA